MSLRNTATDDERNAALRQATAIAVGMTLDALSPPTPAERAESRSYMRRMVHGVDCYRPTSDEADRRYAAQFEMNDIEMRSIE
ncbi:MAG: hypothetical protein H0W48_00590 [Methylibium sp.]|nr:hypothetical protein [Methylibium sp.]